MMLRILTFLLPALVLLSCTDNTETEKIQQQLKGEWKGVEVSVEGTPQEGYNFGFNFKNDTAYTYSMGSYEENGKYWLDGNKLFTKGEGQLEKKVEIAKVTEDSLFLNMNNAGSDMRMVLVRK